MAILSNVMEQGQILGKHSADMGKSVVFAGLGVVSFIEERSRDIFGGMIGKGQEFQKDELASFTEKVRGLKSDVKTRIQNRETQFESRVQGAMTGVLHRLGVPTKSEVRDLIDHVEELTRKVEALKEEKVKK